MKPGVVVPALGTEGWIKEPVKSLDKLIAYTFESNRSQSYSYGDHIVSIPYIYATYKDDPEEMAKAIGSQLTQYLSRHFPVADVQCNTSREGEPEGKVALILSCSVTDATGKKHDLNKVIKGDKSKVLEILNYLNG